MKELVLNFWFIIDIGTYICQDFYVRPYYLEGEDDLKFQLLRVLAETDYQTCERKAIPDNFKIMYATREVRGIPGNKLNDLFEGNMDQFIRIAESYLPKLLKFDPYGGKHQAIPQRISDNPLYVMTIIFENEVGEQRPFTTNENQEWVERERLRLL